MARLNQSNVQKSYFQLSITTYVCLFFTYFIVLFINKNYNPNIEEGLKIAKETLLNPAGAQPEPKERMLFIGGILSMIICAFGALFFTEKIMNKISVKSSTIAILHLLNIFIFSYITYSAFKAANPFASAPQNSHDMVAKTNFDFYFIKSFLHKNFFFYLVVVFPVMLFIALYPFKKTPELFGALNKFSNKIMFMLVSVLALIAISMCSFDFPYTFENKFDLNAVFYSVVQVYGGKPLLVDNFTNTYGLYPHFLMPILKVTGLSIHSFSTIMGILLAICILMISYFMYKTINNKWFVMLSVCTVFYMSYVYGKIVMNYDPYFAIHPIRWLFPSLLLLLSPMIINNQLNFNLNPSIIHKNLIAKINVLNISVFRILLFILFGFGILWNPDFGIFTYLTLLALICYLDFNTKHLINSILNVVLQLIISAISIFLSFSIYKIIISSLYGNTPDISLIFTAIKSFSVVGYYMLPMPKGFHPWMLFALIYMIGWIISIKSFLQNNKTQQTASIFILTLLGTLSLTYYQGRSHNWNLMVTNFEAFILIGIYLDEIYKFKHEKIVYPIFAICVFIIGFAPLQIIANTNEIVAVMSSKKDEQLNKVEQLQIEATAQTIKKTCKANDSILIISADQYQGLYHCLSQTSSALNPGFIDLLSKEQYNGLVKQLQQKNIKVFMEPQFYRPLNTDIINSLGAYYKLIQIENAPNLYYYQKKLTNATPILSHENDNIFYNDFYKNTNDNLPLFQGKTEDFKLPEHYCIETIFQPINNNISQLNTNATLLSKIDSVNGFVFQQYADKPEQYLFAGKMGGISFNVVLNKWNYILLDVYPNLLKVYVNGTLRGEVALATPILNSKTPLTIGSINNQGAFFLGNIKEIKISNNKPDESLIKIIAEQVNKLKL